VDRHDLGLRAADALHLALAADRGLRLVTLDARLRAAALALGVPAEAV
jgi:predicted nucleic acid-binding protein